MAPHLKIISGFLFVILVVLTPIQNWIAFVAYFLLILSAAAIAKIPFLLIIKRSVIEIPFLLFAVLMPFVGSGKEITFIGLSLNQAGLIAAASIIAKGTIGVLTAIIISCSTTAREILRGLETLKMPSQLVQIATFMLRYINVINDEMERMAVARTSRAFEATGIKHWRILASVAGSLFIRSYERGERVHLAMLSRGYEGKLPTEKVIFPRTAYLLSFSLPIFALLIRLTTNKIGF